MSSNSSELKYGFLLLKIEKSLRYHIELIRAVFE